MINISTNVLTRLIGRTFLYFLSSLFLVSLLSGTFQTPPVFAETDGWVLGPVTIDNPGSCPGGELSLQAPFKSPVNVTDQNKVYLLDTEMFSTEGTRVGQWYEKVPLQSGQTYKAIIQLGCAGLPGGNYSFRLGVFSQDWKENFAWNDQAGSITLGTNGQVMISSNSGTPTAAQATQTPTISRPTPTTLPVQPWWKLFNTYGAFNTDSLTSMQEWQAAGGNAVLVEAAWDRLQSYAGAPLDRDELSRIKEKIDAAHRLGLKVYFSISFQYPPEWVKNVIPKLKNQFGVEWSPEKGRGQDMLDWVWSVAGRRYIEDFLTKTLASVDLEKISAIRTGGGYYNELHFPPDRGGSQNNLQSISYWGFGNAPQSGQDISSDQAVCPLPGYIPFSGSAEQDTRWNEWYLNSLKNFETALIKMHRKAGWKGTLFILHPGYFIRSNFTSADYSYRIELAEGNDVGRMIDGYKDLPGVWPGTTWLDQPDQGNYLSVDSILSPWRKLKKEAEARGKGSNLYGENTGGGNNENMNRIFNEPLANGYKVLFWLSYPELVKGTSGTLANMRNNILQKDLQQLIGVACWLKLPIFDCRP